MDQAEARELLGREGELATLVNESEARPAARNIHSVRPATVADVTEMEQVERLAFPTLFPPTRFRREVERSNTLYLLAVRDWTQEEIALGPDVVSDGRTTEGLLSNIASIPKIPFRLLFQTVGGRPKMPPQYIAGLVGLWFVMDEAHVVIIGNRPGDRRKGIGELLLIAALDAATKHGSRVVTLEVRSSNQVAKALYRKYGFREVGVRKRYYADNNEDAVIMTTPPIQSDEYREHLLAQVRDHERRWGQSERRVS